MPTAPVQLGTLNKIRGSVLYASNSGLNVTAPFLGRNGISAVPTTDTAQYIPVMLGGVPSPEPYQIYRVTIHMLRTQGLAANYRTQVENTVIVGDLTIRTDSITMPDYLLTNAVITNASNPAFNGSDPDFIVELMATYFINSSLFNAA